jgi:hypothetical protein
MSSDCNVTSFRFSTLFGVRGRYDCEVICTSYLRVYLPDSHFSEEDKARWAARSEDPVPTGMPSAQRWLVRATLPTGDWTSAEGCFRRELNGAVYLCPWRLRLRVLTALLAFRGSVPEEVADAFVPTDQAEGAARELASLGEDEPETRSHILHANWHVPLRWFACFEDSERILTEDRSGLRVRYETVLSKAVIRLEKAKGTLETSLMDEGVVEAVAELGAWLEQFPSEGLLELDYAGVASMFEADDLVDDRSAAEVAICLEALESGDLARAGSTFESLTDRWSRLRAREAAN